MASRLTKYEYRVIYNAGSVELKTGVDFETELCKLGAAGWSLSTALPPGTLIMKRPLFTRKQKLYECPDED